MKRLHTLCVALLALVLCNTPLFAEDFEVNGIYYDIISSYTNKTVAVTYRGSWCDAYLNEYSGAVTIPRSVTYNGNTYSVTSIGYEAFYGCSSLTSAVIPNSVTSIGFHAFYDCSSLTSVVIGNSVTSIGGGAFRYCYSLTSVEIPNSVTSIGDWAFYHCSSLTSVEIPNSVTSIGDYAFRYCSRLTSVEIPNSVTSIGSWAFEYCSRLTTATVGCSWKKNPLYEFDENVTVNATLHSYENRICRICGDKEIPTITYIVDGVVYATIQQKAGETPKLPEPPTKEGYTFKGWANLPEVMPDEDITVEAEFTINTYEITYVIDDVVFAKQSVTYGDKITPPTAPEKEGYTFSGWKNLPATMPAHDVKVYGTYAKQQYLLTFIADGEVVQQCYVEYGEKIVPPAAPEKEGHVFDGWKNVPETMPARDLEIQGSYTKQKYLLSFVIDGKIVQLNMVEYGTSITPPQVEEKEGHTFSGWKNLPETMPAHDVTVTGDYEVNTYTVRIYLNGALYQTMAVDYGTVLNIPVPTVPEDMEFKGWTTEIPATMPAHDLDIYGTYDYPTSIASLQANQRVTIYSLNGLLICKDAQWQTVKDKLAAGWYIVNGKKIFVKTE